MATVFSVIFCPLLFARIKLFSLIILIFNFSVVQDFRIRRRHSRPRLRAGAVPAATSQATPPTRTTRRRLYEAPPPVVQPAPETGPFCMKQLQEADRMFIGNVFPPIQELQTVPIAGFSGMTGGGGSSDMMALLDVSGRALVNTCEKELLLTAQYIRNCPGMWELSMDDQLALVKCGVKLIFLSILFKNYFSVCVFDSLQLDFIYFWPSVFCYFYNNFSW